MTAAPIKLSIVIPLLNEADNLPKLMGHLAHLNPAPYQVILVDGGSTDNSVAIAKELIESLIDSSPSVISGQVIDWQIIESTAGRALQMNAGAELAMGDVLLFLHADTQLPNHAIADITSAVRQAAWGRFDVRLESSTWMLKVVSQMMNWRSRFSGIATGDQAIFIKKSLFEQLGGYPQQPLMEDIELCKRLKAVGKPACLRSKVITSARRWQQYGTWRTIGLMWHLRFDYWRGVSADNIKQRYYKT
ncbi:TIGR04283 family arsenosugar biosynthesis glycosyltransferase [Psychrobacter sp. DD43]|uniref:TIGR04283 family arsenosugar biosynthesis glycosyltransferase n=1 Tax=Psychrobacter sp. DD43 TaxID=2774128 RepID=UPI00191B48C4|nr:TIGR04283 family arsenosugar biosynthesis glycosyltransferase [Psychrobacter sp. DD43]|tara:strand:- start:3487 stop:4227 length:741 start_codon:yes stop_codon:yes gene_type:complete